MSSTAILIPARYQSSRLPGKPLSMLGGKPMIQRVVDACLSTGLDTFVLTDNKTIAQAAKAAGARTYISSDEYLNGTERCAGALRSSLFGSYNRFINVQGDMPDVTGEMIAAASRMLDWYQISTIYTDLPAEKVDDPGTVKLVRAEQKVLWCARGLKGYGEWHLGVYGYQRKALASYPSLPVTKEETAESLEQLRWLKNGYTLGAAHVQYAGMEVNTQADLDAWNARDCAL